MIHGQTARVRYLFRLKLNFKYKGAWVGGLEALPFGLSLEVRHSKYYAKHLDRFERG